MPWCPTCQTEYDEPSVTTCSDCHVPLVEEPPARPEVKQKPPPRDLGEPVLLLTMADTLETDMLLSLLREQQIPVYTKIRGFGGYSKIMGGRTGREVEIYVPQQLYKHALGLVIALFPPPGMLELSVAEEDRLEQDTKYEKVPLLLWPWLIFGIGIVAWLIYR